MLGALVLTVGSIADRLGRKRLYLAGLILFAASSLTCGLAPNVGVLIAARGVQGLGGAAMFATTMALISSTYTGRDRGVAFGAWGAVNGAAAAVGPIAGGLLTANFGWRWIFLVNLPVSVVAVALTVKIVTELRDPHPKRVDVSGMVTFTVAAGALTYALIRGDWASAATIALLAVTAVAIAAFVVAERRSASPMLDLALLRNRSFTAMLIVGALLSAAAVGGHGVRVAVDAVGPRPQRDPGGADLPSVRAGGVRHLGGRRQGDAPGAPADLHRHRAAGRRGGRARAGGHQVRLGLGGGDPGLVLVGIGGAWRWRRCRPRRCPPFRGSRRAWRAAR